MTKMNCMQLSAFSNLSQCPTGLRGLIIIRFGLHKLYSAGFCKNRSITYMFKITSASH